MAFHHHFDEAASTHSGSSSGSSSRSSSRSSSSSGSSKKSRSSQTSHLTIKSDHWSVAFMKWATGAPLGRQLALRRTRIHEFEEDWDYDDSATVYSDSSYISYAWVSPKWDDSISEIASRSSSRTSGRLRREQRGSQGRPRFTGPSPSGQPHPPASHPPPPPPPPPQGFMPPPPGGPMYDDEPEPAFFDLNAQPEFYPPPPAPQGAMPAFFDLGPGGGGGGPGKYDDWED
ncbi:hypothetical protein CCHL11_06236 [Colletotrichum chlorophyti]|uniref:Uncharacterized protein n=1 Tax=Colletotrichum chlorophyti TaxID=708187 RepID=A0A1Q8RL82_9PEZI|nr:hypothetical protein CCHL11_06236 [Colletotrichum chlorophyti]